MKPLPDDRAFYIEGITYASNYFFDAHSQVATAPGGSVSYVEFETEKQGIIVKRCLGQTFEQI